MSYEPKFVKLQIWLLCSLQGGIDNLYYICYIILHNAILFINICFKAIIYRISNVHFDFYINKIYIFNFKKSNKSMLEVL